MPKSEIQTIRQELNAWRRKYPDDPFLGERVKGDDAPDQGFSRGMAVLAFTELIKHRERAGPVGRQFQHLEAKLLGGFDRAFAMGLYRAFNQRDQMPSRFRRST